jgi:drug/metabolite transporter (DMT)-like permease
MIYLLLSILTNATIYVLFKWFEKFGVQVFPAITVNYITALVIGLFVVPDLHEATTAALQWPAWTVGGLGLGVVFISIFYLMAITAQKVGISVTTIASKMSLALAVVLFVMTDSSEHLTGLKSVAIVFAIAGVIFSSLRDDGTKFHIRSMVWPLLILLGSTIIDFGIAHFSSMPTTESELKLYSCLSFGMAAVCGWIILIINMLSGKMNLRMKDIGAGVLLGVINYGSIFFLVQSYNTKILQKSSLLPINNLGVVILGAVAAIMIFKETLSRNNWIGIGLSIVALVLLLV